MDSLALIYLFIYFYFLSVQLFHPSCCPTLFFGILSGVILCTFLIYILFYLSNTRFESLFDIILCTFFNLHYFLPSFCPILLNIFWNHSFAFLFYIVSCFFLSNIFFSVFHKIFVCWKSALHNFFPLISRFILILKIVKPRFEKTIVLFAKSKIFYISLIMN